MQSQHTLSTESVPRFLRVGCELLCCKVTKKSAKEEIKQEKHTIAYPFFDFLRVFTNDVTVITANS